MLILFSFVDVLMLRLVWCWFGCCLFVVLRSLFVLLLFVCLCIVCLAYACVLMFGVVLWMFCLGVCVLWCFSLHWDSLVACGIVVLVYAGWLFNSVAFIGGWLHVFYYNFVCFAIVLFYSFIIGVYMFELLCYLLWCLDVWCNDCCDSWFGLFVVLFTWAVWFLVVCFGCVLPNSVV